MPDTSYDALRDQIRGLLTQGSQFGRRAAEWEKVETYWHIGDAISSHLETIGGTTQGQGTIRNLSKDIHLSHVLLYEILRFRRQIPRLHARVNLGWTHYRALLALPPDRCRHYEELADEQAWTTRQLRQAVEAEAGTATLDLGLPVPRLRPYFGQPFTYRIVNDPLTKQPAVDFGFHNVWVPGSQVVGLEDVEPGDLVRLDVETASVRRGSDQAQLWTYSAGVDRIIDGDTIDVVVDLGLGHRAFPRLRLRGIDTAELFTETGRRARRFVEAALADVERLLITTRRTDVYGRYLADVKYLPGVADAQQIAAEGHYLNRQLLDEGLASRYLV